MHNRDWNRRDFLNTLGLAATSALLGMRSESAAAAPPPETTRLRIPWISPRICRSPERIAEELFRAEGFTDVQYVEMEGAREVERAFASGEADIGAQFSAPLMLRLEAGDPIVVLGGEHAGCFELLAGNRVHTIRDLKGRTVAVPASGSDQHVFLAIVMAYVGLDPRKDINWVNHSPDESMALLAEGKIDAYLGFPPYPQESRAKKIGHIVVNSAVDRPWSQYFCCMLVGNREFVRKNPVATKRALRAILKSADLCAVAPERAARSLIAKGLAKNYDYTLQTIKELPYGRWREFDPEDTMRFYSLRLREVGMIKSSPQKIIAEGADWRFLRELKKELKA